MKLIKSIRCATALIVVAVTVDYCDASVLKGTRSVGSTARAL
jgi:hypothetical protein